MAQTVSALQNPEEEINLAWGVSSFPLLTYSSKGYCCFYSAYTAQ